MLKSVLYYLLFATTALRLTDLIFLIAKGNITLPIPVLVVSVGMVLYGLALIVRKLFGVLRVKQLMAFYLIQAALVVFNLAYVAISHPLQLSLFEIIAIGSFLDILLDAVVVYYCTKRLRSSFIPVPQELVLDRAAVRENA